MMKALFHTFYVFSGVLSISLYGMGSTEASSGNGTPVVAPKVVRQGESSTTTPQTPKKNTTTMTNPLSHFTQRGFDIDGDVVGPAKGRAGNGKAYGSLLSPRTIKK